MAPLVKDLRGGIAGKGVSRHAALDIRQSLAYRKAVPRLTAISNRTERVLAGGAEPPAFRRCVRYASNRDHPKGEENEMPNFGPGFDQCPV